MLNDTTTAPMSTARKIRVYGTNNTQNTGINLLHRAVKETPPSEKHIRGVEIYKEDIPDLERRFPKSLIERAINEQRLVVVA